MRQTLPPAPLASHSLRHIGPERQSEGPRRHCPGQGPSICTLLKVKQTPCTKALCIPLAFFKTYHLSCVRACVCFPGRTLLELLIFGNVAVLSESKHATRFRGQPQTFFSALVSSWLLTDASLFPAASHDRSHWTPGVGITAEPLYSQDLPPAVGRKAPQTSSSETPKTPGAGFPS